MLRDKYVASLVCLELGFSMGIFDFLFRRSRPPPIAVAHSADAARPGVDHFGDRRAVRDLQWRQLLQGLEHPYELVPGARAQAEFEAAQVLGRMQGFSPLIIEPGLYTPISAEPMSLNDGEMRTPAEYFASRAHEFAQEMDGLALFDHVNEVAPKDATRRLSVLDMLSETRPASPYAEVAIVRMPCAESWKIPLFVHVGPPFDQSGEKTACEEVGIEKEWYERFGAELCCIGRRIWQFRVTRPPRDHAEAVELLRQHYLYSWAWDDYDEATIENGAAALRVDTYWMFVWV